MPVQKGKRRRRPRNRGIRDEESEIQVPRSAAERKGSAAPVRRRRAELPLWANVAVGLVIIGVGTYLFVPRHGSLQLSNFLILLIYFALGGLYIGRAALQYRKRRQAR